MLAFKSTALIQRKIALALASILSKASTRKINQDKTPPHHSHSGVHNPILSQEEHQTCTVRGSGILNHPNPHPPSVAVFKDSRWPARRLQYAITVIHSILEAHGARMPRSDLREAVRQHIGDTGMIDFVIKHIDKVAVGTQSIRRVVNPATRTLEFSIHNAANTAVGKNGSKRVSHPDDVPALEPGLDVYEDVKFLYNHVLLGYPANHVVGMAGRTVLDGKHFVKKLQYKGKGEDKLLRLICRIRPGYQELVKELTRPLPPGELVVIPQPIKVGELKLIVQCALRDTYFLMDKFIVKDLKLGELEGREDQDVVICEVGQGVEVWVRGCGLDLDTKLRYQGGADDWMVDCICGGRDDDGERMVACDVCHVWEHTKCNGIGEDEAEPSVFICCRCKSRADKKHNIKFSLN